MFYHLTHIEVSMMVQRWRISSNSQLLQVEALNPLRCLWWFKDEEFQAIHNCPFADFWCYEGVYDGSKMKNFKQFTAEVKPAALRLPVSMMVQRWRISSNSQRHRGCQQLSQRCLWWFKDEEFQAIHNMSCIARPDTLGVYDGSKMKNFKQFTTSI